MRKKTYGHPKNVHVTPDMMMRPDFEMIRMSEVTLDIINSHYLQKKLLDMTVELACMQDLIRQLDPQHMYLYSAEYQAFVKTRVNPHVEEDAGTAEQGAILRKPGEAE